MKLTIFGATTLICLLTGMELFPAIGMGITISFITKIILKIK